MCKILIGLICLVVLIIYTGAASCQTARDCGQQSHSSGDLVASKTSIVTSKKHQHKLVSSIDQHESVNNTTSAGHQQDAVACPVELNPPKVVVKYGDSVSVNCTASISNANGMSWESTVGGTDLKEVVQLVTWRVEELTEWTVKPQCLINTDDTGNQCEKVLTVILYKTPDSVSISSVNHTGPMVEVRHYQLHCDIEKIAPVQYLTVKWYKGQTLVNQTSFDDLSKTPVNESSTLLITPSRADDGAQYRCVAELHLGPEGPQPPPTVTSEPLNITVHYPPSFSSPEEETFEERQSDITLNCTAVGNPPPVHTWNYTALQKSFVFEDKPLFTSSSLIPGTYTCTVSNKLGKESKQFIIKPKKNQTTFLVIIGVGIAVAVVILAICVVRKLRTQTEVTNTII